MIGWNATLRSLAVVTAGAVVTFCGVKVMTHDHHQHRTLKHHSTSVHGCKKAKRTKKVSPLRVDTAQFGLQTFTPEGDYAFVETKTVPLTAGTSFGWRLHLENAAGKDAQRTVRMKEVFILPGAPTHWGIGARTKLNGDLTQATTRENVNLQMTDGWIASAWSVSAGDPPGRYKMMVFLDDQLVKTFEFDVAEQAKKTVQKKVKQRINVKGKDTTIVTGVDGAYLVDDSGRKYIVSDW